MKKLLGIVVLGLFWSNISFADQQRMLDDFTQWLYDNGHHEYLNLNPATKKSVAVTINKTTVDPKSG